MTANSKPKRIKYIDVAKGIGIVLVLVGHTGFIPQMLKQFIYAFHMPLFFVLAGFLMAVKGEAGKDLKSVILHKAKGLLVPYVIFSVLYLIVSFIEIKAGVVTDVSVAGNAIRSLFLYGDSVLWFLPCLFFAEAGGLFIANYFGKNWQVILTIALGLGFYLPILRGQDIFSKIGVMLNNGIPSAGNCLIMLWMVLLRSGMMLVFLMAGYLCKDAIGRLSRVRRVPKILVAIVSLLATFGVSLLNQSSIDIKNINIGNPFLFITGAMLGSVGIITLSMLLERVRILRFWGRNSLIIMCTHLNLYVMYLAISWAWLVDRIVTHAKSYIFLANIMLATLIMESLIIIAVNKLGVIFTAKVKGPDRLG